MIIFKPSAIYEVNVFPNYFLPKIKNISNYYHTRNPFEKYILSSKEFRFEREMNSIGISDKEIEIIKPNNTIRILCLGDSFTEGDGTDKDSSYVRFLDRSLRQKFKNIEIINAGRCGSDPFFDFKLYQDILHKYSPDIIIQSFTTNDLFFDMVRRGGNERFRKDKTLKYNNNYWWTPIYAMSFVSRIFIQTIGGYDKYLIKQKEYPQLIEKMKNASYQLFKEYNKLTQENHCDLIVFTLPFKNNFDNQENNDFYYEMNSRFSKYNIIFNNLQPCYEDEIKRTHSKPQDYYWKIDGHHNAKGYKMMAKCLEEIVTPIIKEKINKNVK